MTKNATSLRSKKSTKQAVKLPMPSNNRFYHKKHPMSSGKGKKEFRSERDSASFSNILKILFVKAKSRFAYCLWRDKGVTTIKRKN